MTKAQTPKRTRPRDALRGISLFMDLEDRDLEGIAALAITKRYRARQVIVRQQEPGDELFAIMQGHTKVVTSDADGHDTVLAVMGPGQVFGEVSLLDGAPRSATIIALASCELLAIRREPFMAYLEAHPKIATRLLVVLAGRLRRLTKRAEDIAFLDVAGRLAKKLLGLAEEYGMALGNQVRVVVKLSQQELGDMVGTSRESVNKHLRAWEQQGIISQQSGYLTIHDLPRLRTLACCEANEPATLSPASVGK